MVLRQFTPLRDTGRDLTRPGAAGRDLVLRY